MDNSVPRTTLPVHGTTRYIRTHLAVNDGMLEWEVPRTLLGIVPVGSHSIEVPVAEISSLRLRRVVFHPLRLAVGVAGVVVPWLFLPWWGAVPLLVVGLWTILIAFGQHLELVTKGGSTHLSQICFGHTFDAELYTNAVEDIMHHSSR